MLSELKVAFRIGFMIFLPFLIIDPIVASILMSLGMIMAPPILDIREPPLLGVFN